MKKSLIAFAALAAVGAASAQSSVTLYGLIDANVGKDLGSAQKRLSQGAQSRLGVRGSEDLGGGLAGVFQFEHRFAPTTGQMAGETATTFWQARSTVGLKGAFGQVLLGREYTASFWQQLAADPWGYDTVASSLTSGIASGGVAKNRSNNAITYDGTFAGLRVSAQIAESNNNGGVNAAGALTQGAKKPVNFGIAYAGGPLQIGVGYEDPAAANDKWTSVRASYAFGAVKVGGFYGKGTNAANADVKSAMLTATVDMGPGQFRIAGGKRQVGGTTNLQGVALGYHHALSKRTTIYADVVTNSKLTTEKNGYDFGVKHAF